MVKTELSESPLIYTFDNFFSKEECEHICNVANPLFQRATVSYSSGGGVSNGRTGKNCWLRHDHDLIVKSVCNRISELVKIPLVNCESMQVIYYDRDQEYRSHYDSWTKDSNAKNVRCLEKGGNRIVTCLGYLNEVEEGGETEFTNLKIKVSPKIGKLLVFHNCNLDNNSPHINSLHSGRPVLKGEKYAFNLWFREFDISIPYTYSHDLSSPVSPTPLTPIPSSFITDNKNILEIGDILPYITIKNNGNQEKKITNCCENKMFMFALFNGNLINVPNELFSKYHLFVYNDSKKIYTQDPIIRKYFNVPENGVNIYILNMERRLVYLKNHDSIPTIFEVKNNMVTEHVPYVIMENVLSAELLKEVLEFYKNTNNKSNHNTATKNRLHVHPDKQLEIKIDAKLSRSIYQKMKDTFQFDVKYRELYKICCYSSETNGRFHAHRDSVEPYLHRAYGMSLALNDDYEGGELEFVEFGRKIKLKANSAVVFPGIYIHKVNEVTKGQRYVIISFLCKEIEGKTKNNPNYMLKNS